MNTKISFAKDFISLVFSPQRFFAERFVNTPSSRTYALGFLGTFLGLLLGALFSIFFATMIIADFTTNQHLYENAYKALGLNQANFLSLVEAQKTYSILLAILSPVVSYMAPHIFGGALFFFLWLLAKKPEQEIRFTTVLSCAATSLTSMAWYMIPAFGPIIALVSVCINVSRALFVHYQLQGILKNLCILSAVYFSFFLTSATLQVLAQAFLKSPIKIP